MPLRKQHGVLAWSVTVVPYYKRLKVKGESTVFALYRGRLGDLRDSIAAGEEVADESSDAKDKI